MSGGRPSDYNEKVKSRLLEIKAWCRDGATNEEIAESLGINPSTLYEYKKAYPEFSNALKEGKAVVDIKVENALLNNALGYDYEEETVVMEKTVEYKDGKKYKEIIIPRKIKVTKHKESETKATMFWLQNRKPDTWKNRQTFDGNLKITKLEDLMNENNEESEE